MSKKVPAAYPSTIKYDGVYDWPGLYALIHHWLHERGYETHDKTYKHTAGTIGAEEEHIIIGEKKETEYVQFIMTIDMKAWGVHTVEVIKDGRKHKLQKAVLRIIITPQVNYDYQGKFEQSKFLEKVRNFYHTHVLIDEADALIEDKLYYISYKLHTALKEFLGMTSSEDAFDKKYW